MEFKLTVTTTYEIPDERLEEYYGTTDPNECAKVDELNMNESPEVALEMIDNSIEEKDNISVEPVE